VRAGRVRRKRQKHAFHRAQFCYIPADADPR
jgi:hypothetical protein